MLADDMIYVILSMTRVHVGITIPRPVKMPGKVLDTVRMVA
jgi:hypothetical protein